MTEVFLLLIVLIIQTFFGFLIFEFKSFRFDLLKSPLYLIVAIPVVSLIYFFLTILHIPFQMISLLIMLSCVFGFTKTSFEHFTFKLSHVAFIIFVIMSMLPLAGSSFFEGITKTGDISIISTKDHDALWHIGLTESIENSIPPVNPVFAFEKLKNYHYLTDAFMAFLSQITKIPVANIYLKWFPFILSFLLIYSTHNLFYLLAKRKIIAYLASLLVFFSSSLSYLVPLFFKDAFVSQSNFWLDQPTRYLVNLQLSLSLIVTNAILFLILNSTKKYLLIITILLSSLVGIKIYGFIILLLSFYLIGFFNGIKNKDWDFLKIAILASAVGFLILAGTGVNSGFPFIFKPGWFIESMYQSLDRLNYSEWEIHRQLFLQTSNYPRLIFHWFLGIIVFFTGNFGLKIIGLFFANIYLI